MSCWSPCYNKKVALFCLLRLIQKESQCLLSKPCWCSFGTISRTQANCQGRGEKASGRTTNTGLTNRALVGYSFKTFTVNILFYCFVKCFHERCRCQDYQMKDERKCELLNDDKFSVAVTSWKNKAMRTLNSTGSTINGFHFNRVRGAPLPATATPCMSFPDLPFFPNSQAVQLFSTN